MLKKLKALENTIIDRDTLLKLGRNEQLKINRQKSKYKDLDKITITLLDDSFQTYCYFPIRNAIYYRFNKLV